MRDVCRMISTGFWTDNKVIDFSANDRLVFLYLLTNKHTMMCGCYELNFRVASFETGLTVPEIEDAVRELSEVGVIRYSSQTREVLIVNWMRYNASEKPNDKRFKRLLAEIPEIKDDSFRRTLESYVSSLDSKEGAYKGLTRGFDAASKGEGRDPITIPIPNPETIAMSTSESNGGDSDSEYAEIQARVLEYLNQRCGTNYRTEISIDKSPIVARLRDGFTEDDMKTVIDKKVDEWSGTEFEMHLNPDTLFGARFEKYLNQKIVKKTEKKSHAQELADKQSQLLKEILMESEGGGLIECREVDK